jgi:hypothetical protein
MDSHSRSNRKFPKGGFPIQEEPQNKKPKHLIHPSHLSIRRKLQLHALPIEPDGSHLIVRAGRDTYHFDLVEQILLQRDFIID